MASLRLSARSTLVTVLGCVLFLFVTAPAALAHDRLKSSSPGKDAEVSTLKEIELEFTGRVAFPTIILHDEAGKEVPIGKARTDGDKAVAEVPESLPGGRYSVAWRVVSSDGHPIEGEIPFTLEGGAAPTPSPSESSESSPPAAVAAPSSQPPAASAATPVAQPQEQGGGVPAWLWIVVGVLVVIGLAVWLRTGRREPSPGAE